MSMTLKPLLMACAVYIVGTAVPGPAILLIITSSTRGGCRMGIACSVGILCGTLIWGIVAASGIAVTLSAWTIWADVLRIAGGLYFLWLSIKSVRNALSTTKHFQVESSHIDQLGRAFGAGMLIQLSNPQTVLTWFATIAVGTSLMSPTWFAYFIVSVCWGIGMVIYFGYAILFSSERARAIYAASHRKLEAIAGIVFGIAGWILLFHPA